MRFEPLELSGAFIVDVDPHTDDRGLFARTWSADEFAARGLVTEWVESSTSYNRVTGTLRGLHFQAEPHPEVKLVRCTRGAAFDVIVDLRTSSPTYLRWVGVELTADNRRALYVPADFAHGFQTLADDTEINYQTSARYHPELARGVRWDDSRLDVRWPPCERRVISNRDRQLPSLQA
jgi:dTDP-4-dehydrorhamnose 3,5-epimerase